MSRLALLLLLAGCATGCATCPPAPPAVSSLPDPELGRVHPRLAAADAAGTVAAPHALLQAVDSHTAEADRYVAWQHSRPANLPVLSDLTAAATSAKLAMVASCHRGRCGRRRVDELLRANAALSDFLRNKQD